MFGFNTPFLRHLRHIIALDEQRTGLREVIFDFIDRDVLPKLNRVLDDTTNMEDREDLEAEIADWKEYGERGKKSDIWGKKSGILISKICRNHGLRDLDAEGYASRLAAEFYTGPLSLKRFDVLNPNSGGPRGLQKLFMTILQNRLVDIFRRYSRSEGREVSLQQETDEGTELGDELSDEGLSPLSYLEKTEFRRDLLKWVGKRLKGDNEKQLFKLWLDVVKRGNVDRFNWTVDLFPEWSELTGNGKTVFSRTKKKLVKLMVQYLERQGLDLDRRQMNKLNLVARVVTNCHHRIANWVLKPYYLMRNRNAQL